MNDKGQNGQKEESNSSTVYHENKSEETATLSANNKLHDSSLTKISKADFEEKKQSDLPIQPNQLSPRKYLSNKQTSEPELEIIDKHRCLKENRQLDVDEFKNAIDIKGFYSLQDLVNVKIVRLENPSNQMLAPVSEKPMSSNSFFIKWFVEIRTIEDEQVIYKEMMRTQEITVNCSLPEQFSTIYPQIEEFMRCYEKKMLDPAHELDFSLEDDFQIVQKGSEEVKCLPSDMICSGCTLIFPLPIAYVTKEFARQIHQVITKAKGEDFDMDNWCF